MLKAAVIGVGSMGRNHARVYREMEAADLVAVVDNNPQVAGKVGADFSTTAYTDYQEMLDKSKPDLVSLAVPTQMHFQVASDLIRRGVHVLVEKPIASTLEEAATLIELAAKHDVTLQVGHIERFNPAVRELRRKIDEGMLGSIYSIHAMRLSPYPARIRDCGVVLDLASHDIDLFRYLIEQPILRLYGETLQTINSGREDMFNGLLRFADGSMGVLDVNWVTPKKIRRLTITGALGMFTCDLISQELLFYENDSAPTVWDALSVLRGVSEGNMLGIRVLREEPLVAELNNFVQSISEGHSPTVSGEDGYETLRLALEFVQSADQQEVVHAQRDVEIA
jgi:UDP-N-acetylglucosamine 3-dehydrogenase